MEQAESWAELEASLSAVDKAIQKIPAPPVPHDSWGMKMNELLRAWEGVQQLAVSMRQMEDEQ